MKSKSLVPIVLGGVICLPAFVTIGGAPVFYVQAIVISVILALYTFNHEPLPLTFLDQLVLLYVFWALFSFVLNVPLFWTTGRVEIVFSQFSSLLILLFTMSPYLLGRHYFDSRSMGPFLTSVGFSFALVLLYYAVFFFSTTQDPHLARQTIAQRIPMLITFIAWGYCALGFWGYPRRLLWLALWAGALMIVLFSLTRACYYQWFVSGIAFLSIKMRGRMQAKYLFRAIALISVFAVLLVGLITYLHARGVPEVTAIVDRVDQLVSLKETLNSDESASVRVEIWKRLIQKLENSPAHFIFGYGQLAPSSYLGGNFVSLSGEFISTYNAHSQYVDAVIRGGIVGLVLELVVIIVVVLRPLRMEGNFPILKFFQAHSAALVGAVVYGLFHETLRWQMFAFYFWLYAGIVSKELYAESHDVAAVRSVPRVPVNLSATLPIRPSFHAR